MKRWFFKRWTWAGVFGITAAVGLALGAGKEAPSGPPKIGDVTTLKFQNGPDKQVKVLKVEKQADGSYQMEVKDLKSGEVFTLLDRTHEPPVNPKAPANGKTAPMGSKTTAIKPPESIKTVETKKVAEPKVMKGADFSASAKAKFSDPLLPHEGAAPEASKERRVFTPTKPNTVATPTPMPEPMAETQKKPGVIGRLFGKKPAPTPAMPAATPTPPVTPMVSMPIAPPVPNTTAKPAPVFMPQTSVFEPGAGSTRPAPRTSSTPSTVTSGAPKLFPDKPTNASEPPRGTFPRPQPSISTFVPPPDRTPEPPRTLPMAPVTPPTPVIPVPVKPPVTPPTSAPAPLPIPTPPAVIPAPATTTPVPTPAPTATPAIPVPATPAPVIPAVPSTPALPTIPSLPGGMSMGRASVTQAGFATPAAMALASDIQPHVTALRSAVAPSMRAMSARALSGGRHASTETVKSILFIACTSDPSPFVRACCIEELCKLGYFDAGFMEHLHKACGDPSEDVRTAAKDALKKMTPQK